MALFEEAFSHGPYLYYHLLSGVDLTLKGNKYIHGFFEVNKGKEFVGYSLVNVSEFKNRVLYYYFFSRHQKTLFYHIISKVLVVLQKAFRIQRNFPYVFAYGSQWVSITNDFVNYILSKGVDILFLYRKTTCCDEVFIQTLLLNSSFIENIYNKDDEFKSCVRKIDWNRGNPYVWTNDDFDELMRSDAIFARKFDNSDMEIVKRIKKGVME